MFKLHSQQSLDDVQSERVKRLLQEADKLVHEGLFVAADGLLQKVFALDPKNETARSHAERIEQLTRQIPNRQTLGTNALSEIHKTRAVLQQRKIEQANQYLLKAKEMFEEGDGTAALRLLQNALKIDPENDYAKALVQRIESQNIESVQGSLPPEMERMYTSKLRKILSNSLQPEDQQGQIKSLQAEFTIPDGVRIVLEKKTRNRLYKDALREIWNKGGLAAFSLGAVERLRKKFDISQFDYPVIEVELIREMRKNKVKATVLVVDEDENVLANMKGTLRANSFAVLVARTIGEALEIVKSVRPDVILSEITFRSVVMGFDFFQKIRSAPFTKNIYFFFMTSQLDRTTKLVGERLGVDDFFVKPIDYELLFEAIDGKLQRSSSSVR